MVEAVDFLGGLLLQRPQAPILGATHVRKQVNLSVSMVELPNAGFGRRWGSLYCHGAVDATGSVGGEVFSVTSSSKSDVDYLGESTKGDLNVKREHLESLDGQATLGGPIEEIARIEAEEAKRFLSDLEIPDPVSSRHSPRGIFCSRTLNLRSISAIGYDMDYTLIHYNVMAWEGRAYDHGMANLKGMGFPVDGLTFDPNLVIRGLIMDKERGNLVKADRFGYIKRAMHGTNMLSTRAVSEIYGRELVDLRKESRWEFLNTFFSVSEAVMFMQMVDRLDEGVIPAELGPLDYKGLFKAVSKALFRAHVEGQLKSEIMAKPECFIEPDAELPLALLDQKEAGKQLLLITNSDYHYTNKMMQHAFNRFLPNDMGWRDLFDMVIVSARKPEFFQMSHPLYEIVTSDGLMRPCFKAHSGGLYSGGSAQMVEKCLEIHGDEILYVGDHIYTDVSQSKVHLRWRTALICRELEDEFNALIHGQTHRTELIQLIYQKEIVGDLFNQLRLALQRRSKERPAQTLAATNMDDQELTGTMQKLLIVMQRLDQKIGPMLDEDGKEFNTRWGYLSRAGLWDKSHLTRQIEKYADIYTSRVSNFLHYTPFMYFRSQEQGKIMIAYCSHKCFWEVRAMKLNLPHPHPCNIMPELPQFQSRCGCFLPIFIRYFVAGGFILPMYHASVFQVHPSAASLLSLPGFVFFHASSLQTWVFVLRVPLRTQICKFCVIYPQGLDVLMASFAPVNEKVDLRIMACRVDFCRASQGEDIFRISL